MRWEGPLDKIKIEIEQHRYLKYAYDDDGRRMLETASPVSSTAYIVHQGNRYYGRVVACLATGSLLGLVGDIPEEECLQIQVESSDTSHIVIVTDDRLEQIKQSCEMMEKSSCPIVWIGVDPSIFNTLVSISKGDS